MPTTDSEMTTGKARLSYPAIYVAKPFKNNPPKFSCTLLIPKTDTKTYEKMLKCVEAAKLIGKEKKTGWKGQIPKVLDINIFDGDVEFAKDKKGPEYKGHWYISPKNDAKPFVLGLDGEEVLKQADVYAGCYVKGAVQFFPYDNASNGVGVSLIGLKKVEDGEPFTARKSEDEVKEMFAEDEDNANDLV